MRKLMVPLSIALFLVSGCTSSTRKDERKEVLIVAADSVTLGGFEIEVSLSKKATHQLARNRETIIVQAYLTGVPSDSLRKDINEMGQLNLGSPAVELSSPGVARFPVLKIARNQYDALRTKDFEVLINVFSGRRSSADNILTVDLLQEPLHVVQSGRHVLHGKLMSEN